MSDFVAAAKADEKEMLEAIGIESLADLYKDIPEHLKVQRELNLPAGVSEMEAYREMRAYARENRVYESIFRGAGSYHHYIPAIVDAVASKENFLTTYTPYQAEVSQGVLQSIFEYQTYICTLTGMDVSNAGVYDGAEAAAEACHMTVNRKAKKVLVSACVHPYVLSVIKTYAFGSGMEIEIIPAKGYRTDTDALKEMMDESICGVYVQTPNYYGSLEEAAKIGEIVHTQKAMYILGVHPIASAVMKSAREYGADIAVGEGQPLGLPMGFGGPYLGFMATTDKNVRLLPGRIVGETKDTEGKIGYVLTLQAREQHIRREKASSNICSNEALCALRAGVYLSAMGPEGLRKAAVHSMSKAAYLREELAKIGYTPKEQGEVFNEFVTACPSNPQAVMKKLADHDILGGLPLEEGEILWCTTEMNTKEEIDAMVSLLKEGV